jgi:arylsulfatase A-like enzyme
VRKFGAQPADTIPRSALIDYAARVLTEFVLPDLKPDIAIFWSGEPDSTYHYRGVGSPEAAQAEAAADAALGRLLAWRDRVGDGEDFQIIVASDHGHITGTDRTDTVAALRAGGFNAVESSPDMSDILCIPGGTAQIYRLGQDARADRALSDWLSEQPWCAGVIAPEPTNAETVGFAALGIARTEHLRLLAIMKSSDTTDMFGVPGVCHFDADLPVGGGMHGGLHRLELANVLILSGSAFRVEAAVDTPAGLIDVAPTVARLVGLDGGDFSGRVLVEALAGHRLGGVEPVAQGAFRLTHGRRALAWSGVGGQRYLDGLVAS